MSKKQYGVVGHPIGHTLSPFIHTRLMSLAGIDGEYGVYHITPEEFGTSFEKLMNELDGINITIPYKQAVMRFLNETDKTAELYGSVNTISIKHTSKTDFTAKGYTTDGIGFSDALKNAGIPIGDNVTVVGCGGVGRVFVNTCLAQGSKHVNILECRQALDNAKNFAQSINERYEVSIRLCCIRICIIFCIKSFFSTFIIYTQAAYGSAVCSCFWWTWFFYWLDI